MWSRPRCFAADYGVHQYNTVLFLGSLSQRMMLRTLTTLPSGCRTLVGLPHLQLHCKKHRGSLLGSQHTPGLISSQQFPTASPVRRTVQENVPKAAAASSPAADDAPGPFERALVGLVTLVTTLFPAWVIGAAWGGYVRPELFNWFQTSQITNGLMFVMLGMGLTLTFQQIGQVFTKQPGLLALGMMLQYTVLPAIGYAISQYWGLDKGLAIGIALVSCMPGGTASNIVAFIARGDMPLSVMMTSASTLMAVFMTPLLSSYLVGQLVPMDAKAMFLSVLQLVLAPVLLGCTINTLLPGLVKRIRPFMPLAATIVVVLIVGSMISCNVEVMGSFGAKVIPAVFVLHSAGFFLGYTCSKALGLSDKVARTNSIEVGMQSSALAAVLAKLHFPDQPGVVAACIMSACTHAMLGSLLAGVWNATVKDPDA